MNQIRNTIRKNLKNSKNLPVSILHIEHEKQS